MTTPERSVEEEKLLIGSINESRFVSPVVARGAGGAQHTKVVATPTPERSVEETVDDILEIMNIAKNEATRSRIRPFIQAERQKREEVEERARWIRVLANSSNPKDIDLLIAKVEVEIQQEKEEAVREERERIMDILVTEGYLRGMQLIPKDESKKGHGSCCYCSNCGHDNDYCVCSHNDLLQALTQPNPK